MTDDQGWDRLDVFPDADLAPSARDRGSVLLEMVIVLALLAVLAVPLGGFVTTMIRTTESTQATATRTALATSAVAIIERADVPDPCQGPALAAAVTDRVTVPEGWTVQATPDLPCDPLGLVIVTVEVLDARDRSTSILATRAPLPTPSTTTTTEVTP